MRPYVSRLQQQLYDLTKRGLRPPSDHLDLWQHHLRELNKDADALTNAPRGTIDLRVPSTVLAMYDRFIVTFDGGAAATHSSAAFVLPRPYQPATLPTRSG